MVQREVAERMTAQPGELNLLGLSVQFYGSPRIVAQVPATAFFPPPKVDSAVVRLDLFPHAPLEGDARDLFFSLARAGFRKSANRCTTAWSATCDLTQSRWWVGWYPAALSQSDARNRSAWTSGWR